MRSNTAITKLQILLLIDIVIVASAGGGFFYIQSIPAPPLDLTKVQLTELVLNPTEALIGQTLTASVNVTNIGVDAGSYEANLLIDDVSNQVQKIQLSGSETKAVEFVISGVAEGTHIAKIGILETPFTISSVFLISDLSINRTEAKVDEPIGISVKVTNRAEQNGNYSVALIINDTTTKTKTGQLDGGASTSELFEFVEQIEGTYFCKIGSLNGTFKINPAAPPPTPAEFNVTNLLIDPTVTQPSVPVKISVNVTNVGELSGSFSLDLKINNATVESKTVQLSGGVTENVEFNVTETAKGTYSVAVGNITGAFSVQNPSKIKLSNMYVKPYEVWVGESVTVVVAATNPDTEASSLSVKVLVDNETVETKTVELAGGASTTVTFNVTAKSEGSHKIAVNTLTGGGYKVVKTGYHTLSISSSPVVGVDCTLNGVAHKTFYSELLPVGTYTVGVPATDPTGRFTFEGWDTGSRSAQISVNLKTQVTVTASFTGGSSCPSLYMWNGTGYVYVADISNHGWLGYINYMNEDGSIIFYRNNPWDYIKLNGSQLQPTNGYYNLTLIQEWNEIFYLDQTYMVVVDHPTNLDVYSTLVEQYLNPNYMGKIYTVSKNPLMPVSAVNDKGENILPQISAIDGIFTSGTNGIQSPAWDNIIWNRLTLNLGNLSDASQIKLIVKAVVDWGSGDDYTVWLDKFFAQPVPNGTQLTPPPYIEVKDANGNWVRVPESRDIPLPPDRVARTYVVDLTGLFLTDDYSIRINNFWNVTYDYIGVDTTPQQNVTIQKINPQAYLGYSFVPGSNSATGNFTKYGTVTELVLNEDDMYVIGKQGDAVSLQFYLTDIAPLQEGLVRDYFLYDALWFKDENGNWGFGFDFTVDPLPFHNMTGFPYPVATEYYPNDTAHLDYLRLWNTRVIHPSVTEQSAAPNNGFWFIIATVAIIVAVNVSYVVFRRYTTHQAQIHARKPIK